ncbi:hypothetical protein EMCRGX_G020188 [Ephydatia muelleri]
MTIGDEIEYISLYKPLHIAFHGYIAPFVVSYAILVFLWVGVYGLWDYREVFLIAIAGVAALDFLLCLFCVWSVHLRCFVTCKKVSTVQKAQLVKVVPTPNNGSPELVSLVTQHDRHSGETQTWFMFQKIKYIYKDGQFSPLPFPVDLPYSQYVQWKGYGSDDDVERAKMKYGKNQLEMFSPDFWAMFRERASAPFFVFQVFCVGLWCLDEYWYYSLFTLLMLVSFEAILVKQQQKNLADVRNMSSKPYPIFVYRGGRWTKISTEELLPGDIISVGRSKEDNLVPCDILLLRGSCIVDESMLTGESVPQMKEPMEDVVTQERLDLERDARLHIISGGTRIVQHTPSSKASFAGRTPDNGCIGYVLRTGFSTSQGKLLRTILYGVKRVTANNFEAFVFILFLLIFAIMAAAYVWIKGTENPERNRYKLFLECTLILTSVVPPELPIELSLAVNTSLVALVKTGIYCTEPFRIPFGGKVDVCCFDKTGTLTTNDLVIQGIAGLDSQNRAVEEEEEEEEEGGAVSSLHDNVIGLVAVKDAPFETQSVLASCNALAILDGELVGDPLEKAALHAISWTVGKGDTVTSQKGRRCTLKVLQRFHFSSALKRMSTVCSMSQPSDLYMATVKGAPETLRDMFAAVPEDYDKIYSKLTKRGARVLALGYKYFEHLTLREVHELKRTDVEKGLTFAGFLVVSCPLKEHTKHSVKCLQDSSHHVTIITGDNPLTACHVARELDIVRKKVLVLSKDRDGEWAWQNTGGRDVLSLDTSTRELGGQYDLCITGEGLNKLQSIGKFEAILPYVKVFARFAPKQKEVVITTFKSLGFYTLMCGDGTNDVGALKHAHVGVALLSTVPLKKKEPAAEEGTSVDKLSRRPLHHTPQKPLPGPATPESTPLTPAQAREKQLQKLMKQMEEVSMEPQLVRLGDASIASPFTSKQANISCICQVIKQGRCTLVTTLQMFKILAVNALILAYSQSVLYSDGIKFSDMQATIQGVLLAGCFLFISRSKPLPTLSKERPLPNIFNLYTILTVTLQFVVHFTCLVYLVREAKALTPQSEGFVDLEKEFEQNVTNSTVYLISMVMQLSNFAVNYKGHPFMESLRENKALLYSLLVSAAVVFVLALGVLPDLSASLQIVNFTDEFKQKLLVVLLGDLVGAFAVDWVLSRFLGTGSLRIRT